jgi:hypothetical protein
MCARDDDREHSGRPPLLARASDQTFTAFPTRLANHPHVCRCTLATSLNMKQCAQSVRLNQTLPSRSFSSSCELISRGLRWINPDGGSVPVSRGGSIPVSAKANAAKILPASGTKIVPVAYNSPHYGLCSRLAKDRHVGGRLHANHYEKKYRNPTADGDNW